MYLLGFYACLKGFVFSSTPSPQPPFAGHQVTAMLVPFGKCSKSAEAPTMSNGSGFRVRALGMDGFRGT